MIINTFLQVWLRNFRKIRALANKTIASLRFAYKYGKISAHAAILAVSFFAVSASAMTPKKLDISVPLPPDPAITKKIVNNIAVYTQYIDEDTKAAEITTSSNDNFINKSELSATNSTVEPFSYTVAKGETLSQIAAKYDIHVATILEANGINASDANNVEPGRQLKIPRQDLSSSTAWLDEIEKQRQAAEEKAKKEAAKKKVAQAKTITGKVKGAISVRTGGGGGGHGFPYGWCTWYVAQKRYVPWGGNASAWLGNARAAGFATGSQPAAGAIVVTGESWWGHVAYVESVSGGSIYISEMNYAGWGRVSTRTISAHGGVVRGYIY